MLGKTLTQLVCPLCGRFVSLNYFDPSGFDLDIYAVEVTGLGRGKGVKVTGTYSILKPGDAAVELIKDRLLDLSQVLIESNCLKPIEVLSRLKIKPVSPQEVHKLKGEVESLEATLEEARQENAGLKRKLRQEEIEKENLVAELENARRLNAGLKRELSRERGEVETLEVELKDLKVELEKKEGELSGLYEEVGDMIDSIEEALTADGEEWIWEVDEEEPLEALKERLRDLLNEYESLASEAE